MSQPDVASEYSWFASPLHANLINLPRVMKRLNLPLVVRSPDCVRDLDTEGRLASAGKFAGAPKDRQTDRFPD